MNYPSASFGKLEEYIYLYVVHTNNNPITIQKRMKEERNAQLFRVGPCLFGTSSSIPGWKSEELIPSLSPFLLPEKEILENKSKIIFSLNIQPEKGSNEKDNSQYHQLVEFEWEGATCRISALPGIDSHLISILAPNDTKEYSAYFHSDFATGTLSLHETEADAFVLNNILMMVYAFKTACTDTVLMHASVIKKDGKGYLFLGKSGTGKSTHTRLWLENIPGCELLNDHNPIVHYNKETGETTVYGSPWSGKTPCYKDDSVPAGAFVRLEQAPENIIKKEGAARAFASLLPSCSCLKVVEELNNGVIETVKLLAANLPVYHLKCLPDRAAAELSFNTIR